MYALPFSVHTLKLYTVFYKNGFIDYYLFLTQCRLTSGNYMFQIDCLQKQQINDKF